MWLLDLFICINYHFYSVLLDVTEISYNNEKSRLLKKNQILEHAGFSSDSDYNYNSDRKSSKKKKKSKKSKKSTKSKKNTITKSKKKKLTDKKDLVTVITLGVENSKSIIEEVLTPPSTNVDKFNSISIKRHTEESIPEKHFKSNLENDYYIDTTISHKPCTKTNNLNTISIKRHVEESIVKKHFKSNGDTDSSVFSNHMNNDNLLYKKNDCVFNNTEMNSLKPLPLMQLKPICKLSSTSETHQYNEKIQTCTVSSVQFSSLPTVSIVPILKYESGKTYSTIEQPTLEPIRIEQKDEIVEGMS